MKRELRGALRGNNYHIFHTRDSNSACVAASSFQKKSRCVSFSISDTLVKNSCGNSVPFTLCGMITENTRGLPPG